MRIAIVGAGIFGVTAAIELAKRKHRVTLFDPGPIPHPLAASTDISKIVRLEYGADETYTAHMERALEGFRAWNRSMRAPFFHETGLLFLCRGEMRAGSFEHESFTLLARRGHKVERVDASQISARFSAWNARGENGMTDGYWNPQGGFAESGKIVRELVAIAESLGVVKAEGIAFGELATRGSRVVGIRDVAGATYDADEVVVAAGSWTPHVLPFMRDDFRSVGQPVFHFAPADRAMFEAPRFPTFGADISRTGYYGFPITPDGLVKVANHGRGRAMHPSSAIDRVVSADEEGAARAFLRDTIPALADAPLAATRICVYCDTYDEHFWIARDPNREGLVVAAGGSGHAFKFAPLLGEWIADALEGAENPALARFRFRPEARAAHGEEATRARS